MGILVYHDASAACAAAATLFAAQIIERPTSVLGFVTGPTHEQVYARLVDMTNSGMLDWSDIKSFSVSEFVPPQPKLPFRRTYMEENLFNRVNIRPDNVFFPEAWAQDIKEACVRYEDAIADAGGIDLQLLGLGKNGSIGFNYPGREFVSLTHMAALPKNEGEDQKYALTMGMTTLMAAERIVMLVTGEDRAEAAYRMLNHPVSPAFPATALQMHRSVTYILDEAAASRL